VGKRLVEGYSKLRAASKALADIPKWNPKVVPDAAAIKQANTAAEQAKAAANQSRTVASRTSKEVDSAKQANAQAKKQADNKRPESCKTNSFVPGTGVVMADGSVKAIDDVAVGDTVVAVAADGSTTHRQVVATITGHGAKDLVGLTLVGSGGGGPPAETITATDGHLFLTAAGAWVPAKDLQVGDQLVDPDGAPVAIGAVEHDTVVATVHNLTVDTDHTYTVVTTDGTDVVTHNDTAPRRKGIRDSIDVAQGGACPTGGDVRAASDSSVQRIVPGARDARFSARPSQIASETGYTTREIKDAIHAVKRDLPRSGQRRNPDVLVDTLTGEVYPQLPGGAPGEDAIGNIFDHLG
jgi:Pretoxin HINT domain